MIGDGAVGVAAPRGCGDHVVRGGQTVGEISVQVQVTAQVADLHQVGELPVECGFDLAAVLAQGGWDPRQAEPSVDLLLGARGRS